MSPNLPRLRNGSSIVQSTQARNLECLSAQYQPYIQNLPRIQLFLTFDTSPAWTSAGVSTLVSKPTSLPHTVCSSHCGRRTLSTPELGYISPLLRTFHGSRRTQRSPTLHYGPQALPAPPSLPLRSFQSSLTGFLVILKTPQALSCLRTCALVSSAYKVLPQDVHVAPPLSGLCSNSTSWERLSSTILKWSPPSHHLISFLITT